VFAADGFDNPLSDQIIAEVGQGPPSLGQAQLVGGSFRDLEDQSSLVGAEAGRRTTPAHVGDHLESVVIEGAQDGIDRVGVDREAGRDLHGVPPLSVEQHHFGPPT